MDPDEVAMVPVPKEHLGAVYALLAELMASTADDDSEAVCPRCGSTGYLSGAGGAYSCSGCGLAFHTPRDGVVVDHENGCWTHQMVIRLRRELGSSVALDALDLVAQRSPNRVATADLVAELGVEPNKLRAELGALSKTSRRLFGRKIWPMSGRQGWGEGDRMGYSMRPQVAEWWLELLPEAQDPISEQSDPVDLSAR